jgi:hypothetical protein
VFVGDGSNHRDSGRAAPGWVVVAFNPDTHPGPDGPYSVRLKAHLVREVEVLFRYALSGL